MFSSKAKLFISPSGCRRHDGGLRLWKYGKARRTGSGTNCGAGVAAVTQTEVADGYVATGTVHSRTAATISSKVMGYVQKVDANVGDSVPAGKVLVVIDSRRP